MGICPKGLAAKVRDRYFQSSQQKLQNELKNELKENLYEGNTDVITISYLRSERPAVLEAIRGNTNPRDLSPKDQLLYDQVQNSLHVFVQSKNENSVSLEYKDLKEMAQREKKPSLTVTDKNLGPKTRALQVERVANERDKIMHNQIDYAIYRERNEKEQDIAVRRSRIAVNNARIVRSGGVPVKVSGHDNIQRSKHHRHVEERSTGHIQLIFSRDKCFRRINTVKFNETVRERVFRSADPVRAEPKPPIPSSDLPPHIEFQPLLPTPKMLDRQRTRGKHVSENSVGSTIGVPLTHNPSTAQQEQAAGLAPLPENSTLQPKTNPTTAVQASLPPVEEAKLEETNSNNEKAAIPVPDVEINAEQQGQDAVVSNQDAASLFEAPKRTPPFKFAQSGTPLTDIQLVCHNELQDVLTEEELAIVDKAVQDNDMEPIANMFDNLKHEQRIPEKQKTVDIVYDKADNYNGKFQNPTYPNEYARYSTQNTFAQSMGVNADEVVPRMPKDTELSASASENPINERDVTASLEME
ncbi:UNVERIFIED_CONTAM: hypothetical protein HDU68_009183 [Siphonaria sp. JEL0065]|nr:hypothetical protein HDU68_009183 [Siphonaria sp. JEL0065]